MSGIQAVVFDLDGVIIDTEEVWEEVRRAYVAEHGKQFLPDSQQQMMGMSTPEWSRHLAEDVGVGLPSEQVASEVLGRMAERYRADLPLIPGSVDAVKRIAAWADGASDVAKMREAFLYADPKAAPNDPTSYRMPIGDIINGELLAFVQE